MYAGRCLDLVITKTAKEPFYITNALGKKVLAGMLNNGNSAIRIDALPKGVYVLKMKHADKKFLKL